MSCTWRTNLILTFVLLRIAHLISHGTGESSFDLCCGYDALSVPNYVRYNFSASESSIMAHFRLGTLSLEVGRVDSITANTANWIYQTCKEGIENKVDFLCMHPVLE